MNQAAIVGYGMVGKATAEAFGIDLHFDATEDRSNCTVEEVSKCRLVFICLPSPVDAEGNYQIGDIEKIIRQIHDFGQGNIFVIRSTVYPGFAKFLQEQLHTNHIISNPEFLSEDTAVEDVKNAPFILLGGSEDTALKEVAAYYRARIKGADAILTDNTTAELAKLAMNSYFATKVLFANTMFDIAQRLGGNYETVKKVLEAHPYGPKNHFQIWYKGKRGINGHCLPKDTSALANYGPSAFLKMVMQFNKNYTSLQEGQNVESND